MYICIAFLLSLRAGAQVPLRLQLLSARITLGSHSDSEKVDKINQWIAGHIRYDVNGFISQRSTTWSLKKTLRRRKALCREYAALFNALCSRSNIPSLTVNGYSKGMVTDESDSFFTEDHCWNAFKADGRWYLSDLTWASGYLGIKYAPRYVWEYELKTRKFPFKMVYTKAYDKSFVFNRGPGFWLQHHPIHPAYQLLKAPFTTDDFENMILRKDSVQRYLEKNRDNFTQNCDYCETQVEQEAVKRNYAESQAHLQENGRNTFSFLHHFVAYDKVTASESPEDTLFLKNEIGRYSEVWPYTGCTKENIQLDLRMNLNQVTHKTRLFRNTYAAPLTMNLHKNQKVLQSNRYFLRKNARFYFRNRLLYFFKYRSLLLYRIVNPARKPLQTKRDRRLLAKYGSKAEDALDKAITAMLELDKLPPLFASRDSSIGQALGKAQSLYERNKHIEQFLTERMAGFEDTYDIDMLQIQDTILSLTNKITLHLNRAEVEIKALSPLNKRLIRQQSKVVKELKDFKRYVIRCSYHDRALAEYRSLMQLTDTVANECYRHFTGQLNNRQENGNRQLALNSQIKRQRALCRREMRREKFYHRCRTLFERSYFRTNRLRKKEMLHDDSKYIRTRLKLQNRYLKRERLRALKKRRK